MEMRSQVLHFRLGGLSPSEVDVHNQHAIVQLQRQRGADRGVKSEPLSIGQGVLVQSRLGSFGQKGRRWHEDVCRVAEVDKFRRPYMYILDNLAGDRVNGRFEKCSFTYRIFLSMLTRNFPVESNI